MTDYSTKWLKKCPVCKQAPLPIPEKRKIFGFLPLWTYTVCPSCGAEFKKRGGAFQLVQVINQNEDIWQKYGGIILFEREWFNITNGGLSDRLFFDSPMFAEWVSGLERAEIPEELRTLPIDLDNNERPLLHLRSVSLHELRTEMVGDYGGVTYKPEDRSIGAEAGKVKLEERDVIKHIDTGCLCLTDRRLVFLGNNYNVVCGLNNIIQWFYHNDGIEIVRADMDSHQYFEGFNNNSVEIVVDSKSYFAVFTGEMYRLIWKSMFYKPEQIEVKDRLEDEAIEEPTSDTENKAESSKKASKKRRKKMAKKLEFTGEGDSVVKKFPLTEGLATFSFQNIDDSNWIFEVKLLNSQGEEIKGLLYESNGKNYEGEIATHVPADGEYLMNVASRGKWTIKVEQ